MGNSASQKVAFFCFKSCLRGENDTELYDALDITDPSVGLEEIKRNYKRLSLAYHPDKLKQRGVEVTPEHSQKFLKLKESYDVLSDPKKRKIYDEFGALGLTITERPTEVDPKQIFANFQRNKGDRCTLALCILTFFAALLVLPVLFSLKCDGTLNDAPWMAIWTPMWLLDGAVLLLALFGLFSDEDEMEDGEEESALPKQSFVQKLGDLVQVTLFILVQLFVLLSLDNVIKWSWFAVFIPWFASELFQACLLVATAFLDIIEPPDEDAVVQVSASEEGDSENDVLLGKLEAQKKYYDKINERNNARKSILVSVITLWFAVFLALKLDGTVQWKWGLVFLPQWVYFVISRVWASYLVKQGEAMLATLDQDKVAAVAEGSETDPVIISKVMQSNYLMSASSGWILQQFAPIFICVLIVCRLDIPSADYSTFIILLPIFVALGCCCCGVFCGLACLSNIDMDALAEEARQQQEEAASAEENIGEIAKSDGYKPPAAPYGTFESDKKSDDSVTNLLNAEVVPAPPAASAPTSEEVRPPIAPVTGIDADID